MIHENNYSLIQIIINLLTISCLTIYLAYIWNNSKKEGAIVYYSIMHFFTTLAIIIYFIIEISPDTSIKLVFKEITFVVSQLFFISFFYFGRYMYLKRNESKKVNVFFSIYLLLILIIALLDPFNSVFVENSTGNDYRGGILFIIIMTIGLIVGETGAVFNMLDIKKFDLEGVLSFITLTLALTISALYYLMVCEIIHIHIYIISILVLITFTALLFGFYMMGFFYSASNKIIRSLEMFNEAVIVLEKSGEIIYENDASKNYERQCVEQITIEFKKILKEHSGKLADSFKTEIEIPECRKILELNVRPYKNKLNTVKSYICTVHDDTETVTAIRNLQDKNDYLLEMNESVNEMNYNAGKLAVLEERNLMAKEIHDILGHSMILALSIFESNRLVIENNPKLAINRLKKAIAEIDSGFCETREISVNKPREYTKGFMLLNDRLKKMAERLSDAGVVIEFAVIDDLSGCNDKIFNTIYRICQESVTNAIKHGHAGHIMISIKKTGGNIVLHIVDNGKGCISFEKGNGLTGMEDRVKNMSGQISFNGFEDQTGFLVLATFPAA